jgi:hypothetical protein
LIPHHRTFPDFPKGRRKAAFLYLFPEMPKEFCAARHPVVR